MFVLRVIQYGGGGGDVIKRNFVRYRDGGNLTVERHGVSAADKGTKMYHLSDRVSVNASVVLSPLRQRVSRTITIAPASTRYLQTFLCAEKISVNASRFSTPIRQNFRSIIEFSSFKQLNYTKLNFPWNLKLI